LASLALTVMVLEIAPSAITGVCETKIKNEHIGAEMGVSEIPPYVSIKRVWGSYRDEIGNSIWSDGVFVYSCGGCANCFTSYDIVVIKWDITGNEVWNQTLGGEYDDVGWAIWGDGIGGIFVCGDSHGEIILLKLAENGTVLWNSTWGKEFESYGCAVWGDGTSIFTCGICENYLSDIVLIKWDEDGTFLWNRTWGGPYSDSGAALWGDGTNIYVCGLFDEDLILIACDQNGTQLWNRTWGGAGYDYGASIWGDGSYIYTCGSTNSLGPTIIDKDMLLVKWDTTGNQLWNRTWDGGNRATAKSIFGSVSSIYVCGSFMDIQMDITRIELTKWNSNGDLIWNRTSYYTRYDDYGEGSSVFVDNSGTIYTLGNVKLRSRGDNDILFMKWESNQAPTITSPPDIKVNASITDNLITWVITDNSIEDPSYKILVNGSRRYPEWYIPPWANNTPVIESFASYVPGSYNFTIVATDGAGGTVSDSVIVTIMNDTPVITHPPDITFVANQTGNTISWTITDDIIWTPSYYVSYNNTIFEHGAWNSSIPVVINVDGFNGGIYNITISAGDGWGAGVLDSVILTVLNDVPVIISPPDLIFDENQSGALFSWTISDEIMNVTEYYIYMKWTYHPKQCVRYGHWISGIPVNCPVVRFYPETYEYSIEVNDGFGGTAFDAVNITIINVPPVLNNPADITYICGTPGNMISWTINDIEIGTYIIYCNGTDIKSDDCNHDPPIITWLVDGLAVGSYNYTIRVDDHLGGIGYDEVLVIVLPNIPPAISQPPDIIFSVGQAGNTISWSITDASTYSYQSCEVYIDGFLWGGGTWRTGDVIGVGVSWLSIGIHNLTLIATDGLGGSSSDTVFVTVLNIPPVISQPPDLIFTAGQVGNIISWIITDASTRASSYIIYQNNLEIERRSWITNIPVNWSLDNLPVGQYNFTIVATDGFGGTARDTVFVTVRARTNPSAIPNGDLALTIVLLATAGAGAVFITFIIRKKAYYSGAWTIFLNLVARRLNQFRLFIKKKKKGLFFG